MERRTHLAFGLMAVFAMVFAVALPVYSETMSSRDFRATDLLDRKVRNTQGDDVGKVEDLILMNNGRIAHVIVSVGGFMGIGDRLVALPFSELRLGEGDHFVADLSKDQLKNRQEFKYEAFNLDQRPGYYAYRGPDRGYYTRYDYDRRYRDYPMDREFSRYGDEPYRYDHRQYGQREQWSEEDSRRFMRTFTPERMRVTHLLDEPVVNHRGQEIGEIQDLIVGHDGSVKAFVLSIDGFAGIDDKTVAQRFRSVRMNDSGDVVLDVSEGTLRRAPEFRMEKK
jgi:sporulation protein YlmC with PRC-barrel domain